MSDDRYLLNGPKFFKRQYSIALNILVYYIEPIKDISYTIIWLV